MRLRPIRQWQNFQSGGGQSGNRRYKNSAGGGRCGSDREMFRGFPAERLMAVAYYLQSESPPRP